jgi:3-hydroxymyristoyl/3-hydroxydecanoyl-(acyl carrier protein) dehydratase
MGGDLAAQGGSFHLRWRFVDRITALEPWRLAGGRKAVSLEEYYLLEPLGREGVLPESLLLEACAELVRWLVLAGSSFRQLALLGEVERFAFRRPVRLSEVLDLQAEVVERTDAALRAACRALDRGETVAEGRLALALMPLDEPDTVQALRERWLELHADA